MSRIALLLSRTGRQRLVPEVRYFWQASCFHGGGFSTVPLLGVTSSHLAIRRDGWGCLGLVPCQGGWENEEGRPSFKLRFMWRGALQTRDRGADAGLLNVGRKMPHRLLHNGVPHV